MTSAYSILSACTNTQHALSTHTTYAEYLSQPWGWKILSISCPFSKLITQKPHWPPCRLLTKSQLPTIPLTVHTQAFCEY